MKTNLSDADLIRIAGFIHEQLHTMKHSRFDRLERRIDQFLQTAEDVRTIRRRLCLARERGWDRAASRLLGQLERPLRNIPYEAEQVGRAADEAQAEGPSLREVYLELRQTHEELGPLGFEPKSKELSVVTEPIGLEGIHLGPFEVRLETGGLGDAHSTGYHVIALDPHPAASNDAVTHPHVSDERLCAGDAAAAIEAALGAGRVFDFFTLVISVLRTYNPSSPFVSLDDWYGTGCYECGYMMAQDDVRWCELCEHDFCSECASYCTRCDETTCVRCLQSCPVCGESVCTSCMADCPDCGRSLCKNCLDDEQCPCHEEEEDDNEPTTSQANTACEDGRHRTGDIQEGPASQNRSADIAISATPPPSTT